MKEMLNDLWKKEASESNLQGLIKSSNCILEALNRLNDGNVQGEDICEESVGDIDEKSYTYRLGEKKEEEYDPDSSAAAWKYYEKMYAFVGGEGIVYSVAGKDSAGKNVTRERGTFLYSENDKISTNENKIRIEHKKGGGTSQSLGEINLAGDCVFNFNEQKLKEFQKIIPNEKKLTGKIPKRLLKKLEYCKKMHHSPYNFSLMPVTGGMNQCKGEKSLDRPDCLLYALEQLYKNYENLKRKSELEHKNIQAALESEKKRQRITDKINDLQKENRVIIIRSNSGNHLVAFDFLRNIASVENYAKIFYHLDYTNPREGVLLNAMLGLGRKDIEDSVALEHYINLAICYWNFQREIYDRKIRQKESDEEKCQSTES